MDHPFSPGDIVELVRFRGFSPEKQAYERHKSGARARVLNAKFWNGDEATVGIEWLDGSGQTEPDAQYYADQFTFVVPPVVEDTRSYLAAITGERENGR